MRKENTKCVTGNIETYSQKNKHIKEKTKEPQIKTVYTLIVSLFAFY